VQQILSLRADYHGHFDLPVLTGPCGPHQRHLSRKWPHQIRHVHTFGSSSHSYGRHLWLLSSNATSIPSYALLFRPGLYRRSEVQRTRSSRRLLGDSHHPLHDFLRTGFDAVHSIPNLEASFPMEIDAARWSQSLWCHLDRELHQYALLVHRHPN